MTIKDFRLSKGLTQAEFAEAIGLSQGMVSREERLVLIHHADVHLIVLFVV